MNTEGSVVGEGGCRDSEGGRRRVAGDRLFERVLIVEGFFSRAKAQSRKEVWGVADDRRDAAGVLGVPLRCQRSGCRRQSRLR